MPREASRSDPASAARSTLAALGQLRRRAAPSREELYARARTLLETRFGSAAQEPVREGFAYGAAGFLSEHTHYSDGFAVLMPLAQGTAIAVQPASGTHSRLALEDDDTTYVLLNEERGDPLPVGAQVVRAVLRTYTTVPMEVAVASAVPWACFDARQAALGVALGRALKGLEGGDQGGRAPAEWERVRAGVAEGTGLPFSLAYVMAAAGGTPPQWMLADTATQEYLPLEAPPAEELGRGLVVIRADERNLRKGERAGEGLPQPLDFHRKRKEQAERALHTLREKGFEGLTAFRDLEHRDLDHALRLLSPELQPLARHLITENRRVQKLVRALRKADWQFLGALLLMSHASWRDDWEGTSAPLDIVVETAEGTDVDGLYGACMTGRGPGVWVFGRPAALPAFFQHATQVLQERFECAAEVMLL